MSVCSEGFGIAPFLCHWVFYPPITPLLRSIPYTGVKPGAFPMTFVALVALVTLATLVTFVSFVSLVSLVSVISLCRSCIKKEVVQETLIIPEIVP